MRTKWNIRVGGFSLLSLILGAGICVADNDVQPDDEALQEQLRAAKLKINELEEEVFVLSDGQSFEEEEDESIPNSLEPWTEYVRRRPVGVLFPKTATIPKGGFFGRFSHASENQLFANGSKGNAFDDLLGLESRVKVGFLVGYGLADRWDITIQRTNGRDYYGLDGEDHSYDLWDVMTKVQLLNEFDHVVDLSVSGGFTYFWQNDDRGEWAGNAAVLVEKSIGRFRVGTGFLYTSLSDWQAISTAQSGALYEDKWYRNEDTFGGARSQNHTVAVPVSLSVSLTKNLQLFGESAFPTGGYSTDRGPSMAAGCRIDTHSHSYSLFLSNTANNSFNSTFTGGYKHDRLDVFGFDITIFF